MCEKIVLKNGRKLHNGVGGGGGAEKMCVLMEAHGCVSQPYVLWYSMLLEDLLLGTRLWSM
tara:strand:- start:2427 stop:2609 length:183 start_codon:yes stop_codon:yes gene_type:complete